MSRERLRIYLRRRQLVNDTGPVVVQCNPDGTATYMPGTVDTTWQEFTHLTRGLDKLSLAWDKINQGAAPSADANPGGTNYDKGISAALTFNDEAFQFIYDHLLANPCGILNAVEVRIDDALCARSYRFFEIKADNLVEAPFASPCEIDVRLREADPAWHCVHKTFIWDNWQHWFEDNSTKQHPCFLTGIEPRPRLVNSVRAGLTIFWQTCPALPPVPLPGGNNSMRRILQVDNFVDAPLVRDIISNACDKCGLAVDTMFHDPTSPYYNLCLYYPGSGAMHTHDGASVTAQALWFHFENRWNVTLAEFLDKLKVTYQAEWYVTPGNTLVFHPKGQFLVTAPVLDLPARPDLWDKESLRYTFNGNKKPAYGRYQYTLDAADLASQEAQPLYNDIVDYDGPANNLMLEGNVSKTFEWAPTGFIRDGRARADYTRDLINDAEIMAYGLIVLLAVIIAALLAGVLSAGAAAALAVSLGFWVANIAGRANDLRSLFGSDTYTGAVRITADEIAQPRLLIWDGASMNRAKAVRVDPALIVPNPDYNPTSIPYLTRNKMQYNPVGGQWIFNYPMYFESYFAGNLYDRFHDALDNPLHSLEVHRTFEVRLDLCCEVLDALGAYEGSFARIGYRILLEHRSGYDIYGRIDHFDILHEDEQVKITGQVLNEKT